MQAETVSTIPVANGRLKFLVAGGVVLLAVAYLVYTATQAGAVYYLTVSELQQKGPGTIARQVRVSGNVVEGTVQREGTTVRFLMADEGGRVPVVYTGVIPDIFGPDVQVVVEGQYGADGVFAASHLLAKCPSKFESEGTTSGS